ncbi:hypothetical protein BLA15945_01020 [Burkholderia lata]|uniref:Uncharacterized protein n=1 Tax=Burkholderia lata (strain ATCC 17760 / DSM 23089 / LMG 22485 / NCIMB 9086 / R18194 / 383) TaxID=482957 RepID=A0A6P2I6X4_BURL3|nr:hypothetical protein BLA15945_01020 [Burkholderia lata]
MKEDSWFASQLRTHRCNSCVQIDSSMQFADTRHVDSENDIEAHFRADGAPYFHIIGVAEKEAHNVHFQLDHVPDCVAQVQDVPLDFRLDPYSHLIHENPNVSFRINPGYDVLELRGDVVIRNLRPFGMDHAIEEISVGHFVTDRRSASLARWQRAFNLYQSLPCNRKLFFRE